MPETLEDRANTRQRNKGQGARQITAAALTQAKKSGSIDQVARLTARGARQDAALTKLGKGGAMMSRGRRAKLDAAIAAGDSLGQQRALGGRLNASNVKGSSRSAKINRQAGVSNLKMSSAERTASAQRGQKIARQTKKQLQANVKRAGTNASKKINAAAAAGQPLSSPIITTEQFPYGSFKKAAPKTTKTKRKGGKAKTKSQTSAGKVGK